MTDIHSDPLDLAADLSQRERDAGVAAVQANMKRIEHSNVCLQCESKTLNGARWCCKECRDDWQSWNPGA